MFPAEVEQILGRLRAAVGQGDVALRIQSTNLETVYVALGEDGRCRVSDDHGTFQYLHSGHDSTYVNPDTLDYSTVREICASLRVEFRDAPVDGYSSVECTLEPAQSIADAAARVAEAIDRIFRLALRPDLK